MSAEDNFITNIGQTLLKELAHMMGKRYIGSGVARQVYVFGPDEKFVIKIETRECSFQNVMEWETWRQVKDTKWAKWFAPCRMISFSGAIMLQERTFPVTKMPTHVPDFLGDVKLGHFGKIGKRVVVHDYGYMQHIPLAIKRAKLVKAKTWEESESERIGKWGSKQ